MNSTTKGMANLQGREVICLPNTNWEPVLREEPDDQRLCLPVYIPEVQEPQTSRPSDGEALRQDNIRSSR